MLHLGERARPAACYEPLQLLPAGNQRRSHPRAKQLGERRLSIVNKREPRKGAGKFLGWRKEWELMA